MKRGEYSRGLTFSTFLVATACGSTNGNGGDEEGKKGAAAGLRPLRPDDQAVAMSFLMSCLSTLRVTWDGTMVKPGGGRFTKRTDVVGFWGGETRHVGASSADTLIAGTLRSGRYMA